MKIYEAQPRFIVNVYFNSGMSFCVLENIWNDNNVKDELCIFHYFLFV
jgi:hypothetical protein